MVLDSLRPGKPPIRTHTRMFSPRWLTMRATCTVAGRRLQQLFPGLFSWLFTWPAERLLGRVSGGACVCVCCLSIERHAGCMKNNSWNVFDLYCSRAPALGVYIWRSQPSLYYTACMRVCVWYCIVESRPHCWDQRGSHLLFLIAAPRAHP